MDGPGQVTSVYDLALIFRACFEHEDFRRYIGTRTARMPAQPPKDPNGFAIQNDNRLLLEYPGALGGKTGYTDLARHTFVGAAERDGRRLVVAMLGAEIRPVRAWQQTAALLDWGFSLARGASVGHLVAPGEAEKLMAPAPSPTPQVATAEAVVALPSQSQPSMVLVMVGVGAVAFGSAWVLAVRLSRRRGAGHRKWRAEEDTPALIGGTFGQGVGTESTAGTAEPAADQTADRTPAAMPPLAAGEASAAIPPAAGEASAAIPPSTAASPTATLPPAAASPTTTPATPLMGQPPP